MRKLASVQRIKNIEEIENADRIQKAEILGWDVVVGKDEFEVGDPCIFCEIDSVLPPIEAFEFLRKSCYNSRMDGFHIKTVRLRGQISQGIVFPLETLDLFGFLWKRMLYDDAEKFADNDSDASDIIFTKTEKFYYPEDAVPIKVGTDLTDIMGVRKFTRPPSFGTGKKKGHFPYFIYKTDETRLESDLEVLERKEGELCYITEKLDGTSVTFYLHDGKFGVCSRNVEWTKEKDNLYWNVALKYDIEKLMREAPLPDHALQGEIVGPSVQKNKYDLDELCVYIFDIYEIGNMKYFPYKDLKETLYSLNLVCPPVLEDSVRLGGTVKEWKKKCRGKSVLADIEREGIIVRRERNVNDNIDNTNRLSFKVINPEFLIKNDE